MNIGKWFWNSFKYLGDPLNEGYASIKDATESEQVEQLEAMEREMKLEDVDDILYEMKRDEEKVDEHEDN